MFNICPCMKKPRNAAILSYIFDHMIKLSANIHDLSPKNDQNYMQMSHLAGILHSSCRGFLHARICNRLDTGCKILSLGLIVKIVLNTPETVYGKTMLNYMQNRYF